MIQFLGSRILPATPPILRTPERLPRIDSVFLEKLPMIALSLRDCHARLVS